MVKKSLTVIARDVKDAPDDKQSEAKKRKIVSNESLSISAVRNGSNEDTKEDTPTNILPNSEERVSKAIAAELETYYNLGRIGKDECPLAWWREMSGTRISKPLIYLSKMAKRILAIPATSAPVERIFSHMGNIITQKRANLNPNNARNVLLLKDTWPHVPQEQKDVVIDLIDIELRKNSKSKRKIHGFFKRN